MPTREQNLNQVEEMAGFVPGFISQTPDIQLDVDNRRWTGFMFKDTALSFSDKSILGVAAASGIIGTYGVPASRILAKAMGWTDEQMYEAVAIAREIRYYSTWLHGIEFPIDQFKRDVDKIGARLQELAESGAQAPTRSENPSREEIRQEIETTLGFVPEWLAEAPDAIFEGDWIEMADWELQTTALPERIKHLCGVAASAASRCPYCNYHFRHNAKAAGATENEMKEAVSIARLIAQMESELTGIEYPLDKFKSEQSAMVKGMTQRMAADGGQWEATG